MGLYHVAMIVMIVAHLPGSGYIIGIMGNRLWRAGRRWPGRGAEADNLRG